jgi:uncharacterized membrane protein
MQFDLALVRFEHGGAAAEAFVTGRDRSAPNAKWVREVGFVEHHHNGHIVMRGTFAGHYVDVEEGLHASERGTAEGALGGAIVGVLLGPLGIAVGFVAGGTIGSQVGRPSETDPEPQALVDQLRAIVPRSGSAIVLIGPDNDVDEMVAAIGDSGGDVVRQPLTAEQSEALQAALSDSPTASLGPSEAGEEAVEASEPG